MPAYNIKSYYNHEMHPFFSPEKRQKSLRNFDSVTSLHDVSSTKDGGEGAKQAETAREQAQMTRFAAKTDNMASNVTISSIHVDPALMAKHHD